MQERRSGPKTSSGVGSHRRGGRRQRRRCSELFCGWTNVMSRSECVRFRSALVNEIVEKHSLRDHFRPLTVCIGALLGLSVCVDAQDSCCAPRAEHRGGCCARSRSRPRRRRTLRCVSTPSAIRARSRWRAYDAARRDRGEPAPAYACCSQLSAEVGGVAQSLITRAAN